MPIDLKLFGSKLRRYREQLGIINNDLSQMTGISDERLKDLEEGNLFPTGDEILILADIFNCDYKYFISNEVNTIFERTEVLFRKHGNSFKKGDRKLVLEFMFLCECEEYLLGVLRRNNNILDFNFQKDDTYFKGHGINAAKKLRNTFGIAENEIRLDVFKLFRELGIHIFRRKLGNSNISGLFINHPVAGKCILVNYDEDYYRQRFTVSHELGHALLDDDKDFNVSFKWDKKDLVEIRANNFASNFLVPRDFLLRVCQIVKNWTDEKVVEWTNKMKINPETLAIALSEADFISNTKYEEIKSLKIPKNTKTDPEIWDTDTEKQVYKRKYIIEKGLSTYYVDLCFQAYREGLISAGRLAEVLLCSTDELLKLAKAYGGIIYYD